uniref:Zinc finger GRF-type domain-containing protein n=2 Tax=Brassica oleracea var. oleracea TaxID=109376 RepID=A0A0D3CIA7_BRAOL
MNMGQDYSYTQPSSEEFDINSLLEAEAALYGDEAQSSYIIAEADQYPPEPEADEGIPRTCYCGSEVVVETSYNRKDPGRRYFSCNNVDDGDSHIWKWWDVAIQEELRETQTQLRMVKDQFFESDQKVAKLETRRVTETNNLNMNTTTGFVNLMYSQSSIDLESPEPAWFGSQGPDEFVFHPGIESFFNIVMKAALDSFFNIYEHKFSLEHAWRELRHDQKWCTTYMVKDGGKEKRKPVVDVDTEDDVAEPESRPVGVKAAKAAGKRKKSGKEEEMSQLQSIMEMKEKLSKQSSPKKILSPRWKNLLN